MPQTRQVSVKDGDVLLLVGTTKGAFLLRSNGARSRWDVSGPHFPGQAIYAIALDQRGGRRRLWAGGGSDHWGPVLYSTDDFGRTWSQDERNRVRFPEGMEASVKCIWQIVPGREREPDVLYAGVQPAALFESRDAGENWSLVQGLWDHPHRPQWQPGGGGLCLHTILPDPESARMTIAISTGGVYRSEDDGRHWQARSKGVRAQFLPDKYPEFGQCVHKIVHHPSKPERLFLQNHWGLYRSDDAGDSWVDIAKGVPSDFGFAMSMHPHDPDTVYILPLESDTFRCTPEGKLRVYRTRNAGESWEALAQGLPQQHALETVLRDGMDVDDLNPAGVYFGTRGGSIYGSTNGGASWSELFDGMPAITCLKAVVVGGAARVRIPKAAKSGKAAGRAKPAKAAGGAKRGKAAARVVGARKRASASRASGARKKVSASRKKAGGSRGRAPAKRSRTAKKKR